MTTQNTYRHITTTPPQTMYKVTVTTTDNEHETWTLIANYKVSDNGELALFNEKGLQHVIYARDTWKKITAKETENQ